MKRSIALFVSALLCAAFVSAESGDMLTLVATVPEKTPSISIVMDTDGEDRLVSVVQNGDARYKGTVELEVPIAGWSLKGESLSEWVSFKFAEGVVRIVVLYDGYRPKGVLTVMRLRKGASAAADAPGLSFTSP